MLTTLIAITITMITIHHAKAATPDRLPQRTHRDAILSNLRAGLAGTPMHTSVVALEAAARTWGISPYFIAAAAGTESAFGRLACRNNRLNLWGLGACDRYWHVPHFTTWQQAYGYYARFIRTRWPRARTAYDLHGYCQCGAAEWGRRTAWHMRRLFDVGPNIRYAG
jgi:hypothetical protein